MKFTLYDLIEKLQSWKSDIDCDIKSEGIEVGKRNESLRQSTQLAIAIGLLYGIGDNDNIPR